MGPLPGSARFLPLPEFNHSNILARPLLIFSRHGVVEKVRRNGEDVLLEEIETAASRPASGVDAPHTRGGMITAGSDIL